LCQDRRQEIETITKFVLILTLPLKTENRGWKSFDIGKFEEMPLVQVQQLVSGRVDSLFWLWLWLSVVVVEIKTITMKIVTRFWFWLWLLVASGICLDFDFQFESSSAIKTTRTKVASRHCANPKDIYKSVAAAADLDLERSCETFASLSDFCNLVASRVCHQRSKQGQPGLFWFGLQLRVVITWIKTTTTRRVCFDFDFESWRLFWLWRLKSFDFGEFVGLLQFGRVKNFVSGLLWRMGIDFSLLLFWYRFGESGWSLRREAV
jgi:hypothetical protein